MSGPESDSERPDTGQNPDGVDEEYDEELAALSGPPPSLRHAVIICVILALSIYMIYFFFPDLSYLLRGLEEPEDLGEAADIMPEDLELNSYVTIHGLPMMHRSIEFKEGIKWFAMSDTTRKLFPLTGQPGLFVQWTEPEERRAYRDPSVNPERLALPYDFTGHLLDRSAVGGNFEKIWVFYDCLESYSLRQCKHCLGQTEIGECRKRFTCAENFPADVCEYLLAPQGGGSAEDRAKLDELVDRTELDELRRRVEAMADKVAARRKQVEQIEREVEQIESGQMKQAIEHTIADLEQRNAAAEKERGELEARVRGLGLEPDTIRGDVKRLQGEVSLAKSEIGALTREATALKADSDALAEADSDEDRAKATAAIEKRLRDELDELEGSAPDGGTDAGAELDAGADGGTAEGEAAARNTRKADLEADLEALAAGALVERRTSQITEIKDKLASADTRLKGLEKSLAEREELAEELAVLPREARERNDKLDELRSDLKTLGSGAMKEEKLAIGSSLTPGLERLKKLEPEIEELGAELEALSPGKIGQIERRIDALEEQVGPTIWILVDGQVPGDKIWVIAVYLVFLVMIGFNLRRLYRFWIAWRS